MRTLCQIAELSKRECTFLLFRAVGGRWKTLAEAVHLKIENVPKLYEQKIFS